MIDLVQDVRDPLSFARNDRFERSTKFISSLDVDADQSPVLLLKFLLPKRCTLGRAAVERFHSLCDMLVHLQLQKQFLCGKVFFAPVGEIGGQAEQGEFDKCGLIVQETLTIGDQPVQIMHSNPLWFGLRLTTEPIMAACREVLLPGCTLIPTTGSFPPSGSNFRTHHSVLFVDAFNDSKRSEVEDADCTR